MLTLTSGAERHQQKKNLPRYDLVITNYARRRRDAERWNEIPLFSVIADEAQQIEILAALTHDILGDENGFARTLDREALDYLFVED